MKTMVWPVAYLAKKGGPAMPPTALDRQSRLRSMSDTLDVLWYRPVTHQ